MLAIACDHGGYAYKQTIMQHLADREIEYRDFGTFSPDSCDYPDYAQPVAKAVASGECEKGILICGTGIGMSIAANKVRGIRAAVCGDSFSARATREHNDANILCLGGRVIGQGLACMMADLFLTTEFIGAQHTRRLDMIREIEKSSLLK